MSNTLLTLAIIDVSKLPNLNLCLIAVSTSEKDGTFQASGATVPLSLGSKSEYRSAK